MKSKTTKSNFGKFIKRNTHKRRSKQKSTDALRRALDEVKISYEGAVIKDSVDRGRRGRSELHIHRDEVCTRGIFHGSKSGFGFVTPEDGYEKDIFIPEDRTQGALHGDLVEIIYHVYHSRSGEEKTEGRVKKIIEFGRKNIIGTLLFEESYMRGRRRVGGRWYVLPDDGRLDIRPTVVYAANASEGDKVSVRLMRGAGGFYDEGPQCEILANFGDTMSKEANYQAILAECEIPVDFSDEELREAQTAASRPLDSDGRTDLRDRVIMTIDGAGAKDLDDAVSLRKLSTGWQLSVHIADVSTYVGEKTALDRAVMARGTSVYFTDKVVPMLPPALSNGACSLNAGEDKYALSAIITLDDLGEIKKCKLEPTIIRSRVRGVYSEVNKLFDDSVDADLENKYREVLPMLKRMRELYQILLRRAKGRGALDMEIAEAEIILDPSGRPVEILKRERGDAERMIEQFMLTANEAVATLLYEKGIPCVYRVHAEPPTEKLESFLELVHNLGFDTSYISKDKCSSIDFARLLDAASEAGLGTQVSYSMLRAMSKAEYSDIKSRHFGLGIESYCHFTSPIRRLSDLATHRIIHKVLLEGKRANGYAAYARRAARAATDSEVRAVNAERRIENLYKVIFMSDFVGTEFDATVGSITSFGMFAELDNTCEGLIPISEMPGLFSYDEKRITLRCGSLVYKLGDRVRVRLEEADMIRGKLRFSLVL